MENKIKLQMDYVLVKIIIDTTSHGALQVPASIKSQERFATGTILELGIGLQSDLNSDKPSEKLLPLKIGQRIVFNKYNSNEFTAFEDGVVLLKAHDIIGIWEN